MVCLIHILEVCEGMVKDSIMDINPVVLVVFEERDTVFTPSIENTYMKEFSARVPLA